MATPRAEAMQRLREEEELRRLAAEQATIKQVKEDKWYNNLFRDSMIFGDFFDKSNYTDASFNKSNIFGDFFDPANYGNADKEGFTPNYNLFINEPDTKIKAMQEAQAMAAKYNAMNNFGDESADFDANTVYKMGNMADENRFDTGARQLSNAEAGAIYSQPLQTNDEIAEYGAGNTGFLNKKASYGYMGSVGDMLGRLRYSEDGTFPARRSPTTGTKTGDVLSDLARAAYQNSIGPTFGMKDMDGYGITGPGPWATDQINRIEAEREYNLPENVEARAVAKRREEMQQAGLLVDQQLDDIEAEQAAAKAEEMKAAGIWATDEIVRQETEQLAAKKAAEAEAKRAAEVDRIRNMQGFIEQQSEMESGYNSMQEAQAALETVDQSGADNESFDTPIIGEEPITIGDHILPSLEEKLDELTNDEKNDAFVEKTLRGEGILGAMLDFIGVLDNDNEGVSEADGDATVNDIAVIAAESTAGSGAGSGAGVSDGLLKDDESVNANNGSTNILTKPSTSTASAVNTGIMSATADDSMEGFTMDRLTNPLSPENKKWWMGGGGGVPGSNRAVQFFEALAYIGTPLKYRPSKTPAQQNIENRMTQMNNLMDYNSSMASSSASANQNTFTKLKAAIPSTTDLEKELAPAFYDNAGMFEKSSETDRKIKARAYQIHEAMTIMASKGIFPTVQKVYADEAEAKRLADEQKRIAEEEQARIEALKPKTESNPVMSWLGELLT